MTFWPLAIYWEPLVQPIEKLLILLWRAYKALYLVSLRKEFKRNKAVEFKKVGIFDTISDPGGLDLGYLNLSEHSQRCVQICYFQGSIS